MSRPTSTAPTDAEFQLLQILWRNGVCTVRDLNDVLTARSQRLAYTSIATIVRIMVEKKYVEITDERRPQKFRAIIDREQTTRDVFAVLCKRYFDNDWTAFDAALKAAMPATAKQSRKPSKV